MPVSDPIGVPAADAKAPTPHTIETVCFGSRSWVVEKTLMYFIAGTVLLVSAVGLMCVARLASVHGKGPRAFREFAITEVMALMITSLYAFGFGALAGGLAAKPTVAGFAELGVALAVVIAATVVIVRLTRPAPLAPAGVQKAPV